MSRRGFGSGLEDIEERTILRTVVGSTVHGLNVSDGLEDRDEMGVCVEPIEAAVGVGAPFEQYVYRTAAVREGRHDAPSQAGDLDLVVYGLRKYVRLALQGNPTVLVLLYAPVDGVAMHAHGSRLRELAPAFASMQAGKRFLGYLNSQRQRMLGERGNGGHGAPRDALTAQFGYDTKFAMHMLRLGFQGVEFLNYGLLTLPMPEPERTYLRDVRGGKFSMQNVLTRAGELEAELRDLLSRPMLPPEPDSLAVESWMIDVYAARWSADRAASVRSDVERIMAANGVR